MNTHFEFSNLIGTLYHRGNIIFTNDGDSLISPVGNRITIFSLKEHRSTTLPVQAKYNFTVLALHPNGSNLLGIDERGYGFYIHLPSRRLIHQCRFPQPPIRAVAFSTAGDRVAICSERSVDFYSTPATFSETAPLLFDRNAFGHDLHVHAAVAPSITCVVFGHDARIALVGSSAMEVKVVPTQRYRNFTARSLRRHRSPVVACFFASATSYTFYSVDRSMTLVEWSCDHDDGAHLEVMSLEELEELQETRKNNAHEEVPIGQTESDLWFEKTSQHDLRLALPEKTPQSVDLVAACYNEEKRLLLTGCSNGAFLLHELPTCSLIQSLSISDHPIDAVSINSGADWLALASADLGQVLVWEWQSETFIMKQQGHFQNMRSVAYSPDGHLLATGGQDGKVKIWSVESGFCTVTFAEHTAAVTQVTWMQNGRAVLSSSLDGSVRAFDLRRYRNFRTFTSAEERPVQFGCLAVDAASELVAAASVDQFDVYLWSVQAGRLLEMFSGHEAPVSSLDFCPISAHLASTSWDKTLRVWNVLDAKVQPEVIDLPADGLCVQFSTDGALVGVCTMNTKLLFFDWRNGIQMAQIDATADLDPGRSKRDGNVTAKQARTRHFTRLAFSPDSQLVLAAGQSRNMCLYHVKKQMLVKRFRITMNRSIDGVATEDVARFRTGDFDVETSSGSEEEGGAVARRRKVKLPGAKGTGDAGVRSFQPAISVADVSFAPTGRAWVACTTEGLVIYTLDTTPLFDPFEIDTGVTPDAARKALGNRRFSTALMMALKLNQQDLLEDILDQLPGRGEDLSLIARSLSLIYVLRLLQRFPVAFAKTRNVHLYLLFLRHVLQSHCHALKTQRAAVTAVEEALCRRRGAVTRICEENNNMMEYMVASRSLEKKSGEEVKVEEADGMVEVEEGLMDATEWKE